MTGVDAIFLLTPIRARVCVGLVQKCSHVLSCCHSPSKDRLLSPGRARRRAGTGLCDEGTTPMNWLNKLRPAKGATAAELSAKLAEAEQQAADLAARVADMERQRGPLLLDGTPAEVTRALGEATLEAGFIKRTS